MKVLFYKIKTSKKKLNLFLFSKTELCSWVHTSMHDGISETRPSYFASQISKACVLLLYT